MGAVDSRASGGWAARRRTPSQGAWKPCERMQEHHQVPMYLWRKYTAVNGAIAGPLQLNDFLDETRAVRHGLVDGLCLLVMQVTKHPAFVPDWRDLLRST